MTRPGPANSSWPLLAVWLLATIAATLFYARAWPEAPIRSPDSYQYAAIASDLRDGSLEKAWFRPPGFPLLLVLTGSPDGTSRVLVYVQLIMHFIGVLLVVDLLRRLCIAPSLLAVIFILGFLPFSVQSAAHVMTEILTEFTLVVGFTGLVRWLRWGGIGWLAASGVAFAYAGITRPTFQMISPFLTVILVGWLLLHRPFRARMRRVLAAAVVLLFCAGIVEGGFVAYNRARFGYLGTVPAGFNLCNKTWRVLERLPEEHAVVRDILITHRDRFLLSDHSGLYIWSAIPDLQKATNLSEQQLAQHLQKLNLLLIAKAPIYYLHDVACSIATYWLPNIEVVSFFGRRSLQAAWTAVQLLLLALLVWVTVRLVGALWLWRRLRLPRNHRWIVAGMADGTARAAALVILAGVLFYTMFVSTTADSAITRYRQPTDLLLWSFIALEIDLWRRMLRVIREAA